MTLVFNQYLIKEVESTASALSPCGHSEKDKFLLPDEIVMRFTLAP
jgi:hypothetical protein